MKKKNILLTIISSSMLLLSSVSHGYYFYYANNLDSQGRPLPSKIAIAVYPSEKKFKQFLKDQQVSQQAQGYIIKYGPVFGKVSGKIAAPLVTAAVAVETGNPAVAQAAGKVTEAGLELCGKGAAKLAKALAKPLRGLQQQIEANHYHERLYMGRHSSKHPNPVCRDLKSMKKKDKITEDSPKPLYVVAFNIDAQAGQDYQVLFNKYLYPMGPEPYEGKYYTGKGKARGGPFASYVVQTYYQDEEIYEDGERIQDAYGNYIKDPETGEYVTKKIPVMDPTTGKQKVEARLVADFIMIHDRGGIDCSMAGKNPDNAPDQGGTLATDTIEKKGE